MSQSKVILITGASSGMGFETAKELIQQGHIVYGAARRIEKMAELEKLGGHALKMDVTQEDDRVSVIEKIIEEQGRIDVLWNNAGFGLWGAVEDVPIRDAQYQFDVNLFSVARLTQLVLPHMRKSKSGIIINTSSVGGKVYTPLGAWYHATKHALEGWSDCLRIELEPFGIHVVVLEPGAIQTEFGNPMMDSLKKNSSDSAYDDLIHKVVRATESSFQKPGAASSPEVISSTISNIVNSGRPKTRYLVGKYAKPMVFLRKWFGDRAFDRTMMNTINKIGN